MLTSIRARLKRIPAIYSLYIRLKRLFTGELPGMTSRTEQEYLRDYGRRIYTGAGEVVDLGSFLGSLTIPLALSLAANPRFIDAGRKVYAFDAFRWMGGMETAVAGTHFVGRYREGDDFLDAFVESTRDVAEHIEIRAGDLTKARWTGNDIELLVVDAMKSWDLANAIAREFYTRLIPHTGRVFHQDFSHFFTPWIHLLQWRLRDAFEFVAEIPGACSVVFINTKRLRTEDFEHDLSLSDFSDAEIDEAFEHSLSLVSRQKWANILAAKVMAYIFAERFDVAEQCLRAAKTHVGERDDLLIVKEIIRARG